MSEPLKKSVSSPTSGKPFLQVEEPDIAVDRLKVINPNPNYAYKWCNKDKMPTGRSGNWVAVDKTHSEFKGMRTAVDHTPDQTFFTSGDLILCCMRKETYEKLMSKKNEKRKLSAKKAIDGFKGDVENIKRKLGDRHDAINLLE